MPPTYRAKAVNPNAWWERAWEDHDKVSAQFELEFRGDIIKPGNMIRIRNARGTFKFRCLAHNESLDVTWIECLDSQGAYRAFHISKLNGLVKPKRSRRKKANV